MIIKVKIQLSVEDVSVLDSCCVGDAIRFKRGYPVAVRHLLFGRRNSVFSSF